MIPTVLMVFVVTKLHTDRDVVSLSLLLTSVFGYELTLIMVDLRVKDAMTIV